MDVVIAGATGLIGHALTTSLERDGHTVRRITRAPSRPNDIGWDPSRGILDPAALAESDALVNLAGHRIGRPHWTETHRRRILDSRVQATELLARAIARQDRPPKILVSGSAVGYYGSTSDAIVTEGNQKGSDFLSTVCEDWEKATAPADEAGIPVVHIRTGIVVSARGGALGPMLPLFKAGLGGRLGSGKQYWPCISLTDHVRAIRFLMDLATSDPTTAMTGPVNLTGPEPETVREIAAAIGHVLHRPAVLPVPTFAINIAVGRQMARELILASQRVVPVRLSERGFAFEHGTFEAMLTAERALMQASART